MKEVRAPVLVTEVPPPSQAACASRQPASQQPALLVAVAIPSACLVLFLESSVTSLTTPYTQKPISHHVYCCPDARERRLDNTHASTGSSASAHLLYCLTSLPA